MELLERTNILYRIKGLVFHIYENDEDFRVRAINSDLVRWKAFQFLYCIDLLIELN